MFTLSFAYIKLRKYIHALKGFDFCSYRHYVMIQFDNLQIDVLVFLVV